MPNSDYLPELSIGLILGENLTVYEREVYSLNQLLEDLGAFYIAITIFPTFLMSLYSPQIFSESITSEIPFQKEESRRDSQGDEAPSIDGPNLDVLSKTDVRHLREAASSTERLKHTFRELVCTSWLSYKKTKKQKLKERAMECFKQKIDIQSFFEVHTNLALLN